MTAQPFFQKPEDLCSCDRSHHLLLPAIAQGVALLSWHRCRFELAIIKNVALTAPARMEVWVLLRFLFVVIETPSGLYCKQGVLSTGVIASPSSWCPVWSAVLCTSIWACVASSEGSAERSPCVCTQRGEILLIYWFGNLWEASHSNWVSWWISACGTEGNSLVDLSSVKRLILPA